MVGATGFGPAISASQTRWDGLTSLHPSRAGRIGPAAPASRTRCSANELQPVEWKWWESNPLRQRLQGAPAALAVTPRCPQDGSLRALLLGAHAVELTITGHVHPAGWCSQGRKDLNLHQRGWSPLLRCRYATPLCNRKPPLPGLSGGRLLVAVLRCYPEASQSARPLPRAAISCENGDAAACRSRLMTDQDSTGCLSFRLTPTVSWSSDSRNAIPSASRQGRSPAPVGLILRADGGGGPSPPAPA